MIQAFENGLVCLLPKLLFTYYVLYALLTNLDKGKISLSQTIISLLLAFALSLLLYRTLVIYFIDPVVYAWTENLPPYLDTVGFLVAMMDIGFASGAAIAIKQVRLLLAGKEMERNLVREKLEAELKFLRNQINPHFLFNTLNNIYVLARKKSDEAPEVVMKLSKLLRFMLYETQKPSIKVLEEIKLLDDYIELEKIRYGERLSIQFIREIDDELKEISPMLLLPFIENAFKHGISDSRLPAYIHVDLKLANDILVYSVENSKENGNSNVVNEKIGLANVKRQLELMYRDFKVEILNEPTAFRVFLKINLSSHAKMQLSNRRR